MMWVRDAPSTQQTEAFPHRLPTQEKDRGLEPVSLGNVAVEHWNVE